MFYILFYYIFNNSKIIEHFIEILYILFIISSGLLYYLYLPMPEIEYVIYCRKSTDESSNKQAQSIPDQIKRCIEFAEKEGLKIKAKPADFSDFESDVDIWKEDHDKEIQHREIYQQTRHLFIIKEQESAKIPYRRAKWAKLMKLVDQWKIKGLLSYSPDRQARNILEWGMIINFVDEKKIDLKYTNFSFEPNASWKMMLWMWFVFSKQYSDKLSEDITRWNRSSASKWKAWWIRKYWYAIDKETWFHKPDWKNFQLIRTAFEMKIYEKKSDKDIVAWLNSAWFTREWLDAKANVSWINAIWRDPFYYWIFWRSNIPVDLKEKNPLFKPVITREEFEILKERYEDKTKKYINFKNKDEFFDISPLPTWLLIQKESNLSFTRYIPSIKRHREKLLKLKKTNPDITFASIIKPHQIYYTAKNKSSSVHEEIHYDVIHNALIKLFDSIKLNKKWYEAYIKFLSEQLEAISNKKRSERQLFLNHIDQLTNKKNDFILANLGKKRSKDEEIVYKTQVEEYDKEIAAANENASKIIIDERNKVLEFEAYANIIANAGKYYRKFNYVQQAKIVEMLVSNIYIDKQKRLTIKVKPGLEDLFSQNSDRLLLAGIEPASNP